MRNNIYPQQLTAQQVSNLIDNVLVDEKRLFCDIETHSLDLTKAGLYSIAFCTDDGNAYAFKVEKDHYLALAHFFFYYKGDIVFHNAAYDVPVLIYELFMKGSFTNLQGLETGIKAFKGKLEDTKIIYYLYNNNVSRTPLGLKEIASEKFGDWGIDLGNKSITDFPIKEVLEYNCIDVHATKYVYELCYGSKPPVKAERFEYLQQYPHDKIYQKLMLKTLMNCIRMSLCGFTVDLERFKSIVEDMNEEHQSTLKHVLNSSYVRSITESEMEKAWQDYLARKANNKRIRAREKEYFRKEFNLNSILDLRKLLYEVLELPQINKTKTGGLGTDLKTLKDLVNLTDKEEVQELLRNIIAYKEVNKILTSFVDPIINAPKDSWGYGRVRSNFNIGGTISGRLSASGGSDGILNLQQIPSTGTRFAKIFKSPFKAPEGWLLVGLDIASLEDRISAILTKDPNKTSLYLEGYDGHSLRTYHYYGHLMPDIKLATPEDKCYFYEGNYYLEEDLQKLLTK